MFIGSFYDWHLLAMCTLQVCPRSASTYISVVLFELSTFLDVFLSYPVCARIFVMKDMLVRIDIKLEIIFIYTKLPVFTF